jgi:hypothetical protein
MRRLATLAIMINFLIGCSQLPPFPTVEVKIVDVKNGKIHRYELPKKQGDEPKYLGSIPYSSNAINKHVCMAPAEYSKLEEYLVKLEDALTEKCK